MIHERTLWQCDLLYALDEKPIDLERIINLTFFKLICNILFDNLETNVRCRMKIIEDILVSDLTQVDKLRAAFSRITDQMVEHSIRDIEIKRALGDQEAVIREQIKMESLKYAQNLLAECYQVIMHAEDQDHA